MTSRERVLIALSGGVPDRLPVTTHHLMPYFLNKYMGGMDSVGFFEHFGMDRIDWVSPYAADSSAGEYWSDSQKEFGGMWGRWIVTDSWRIEQEEIKGKEYLTQRMRFVTPKGDLSMVLQSNEYTTWVSEYLIKNPKDIALIAEFCPSPKCDVDSVNAAALKLGDSGILRGHVCGFDGHGQPGCWQDAACLVGIEPMIMATYDDPEWVHEFLRILRDRKLTYVHSMAGAAYDLIELGGGDASSTVISPTLFDEYVAPYDIPIIEAAHEAGQRIVYHTCGGMMPILENIAAMNPDAMETFTPAGMGGDVDLAEAKRRIGDKVCMIGGFDQGRFFKHGWRAEEDRDEVLRCFEAAGEGGGYILCPSDHFFDADPELLNVFSETARQCGYGHEEFVELNHNATEGCSV